MKRDVDKLAAAAALSAAMIATGPAAAQKQGSILRAGHFDSPASMSMLEESTLAVNRPMMGVFNNLVMFDQHVAQNSPQSIVPDLAMGWSWNEEGTELTMPLRRGVKWHGFGMVETPARPDATTTPGRERASCLLGASTAERTGSTFVVSRNPRRFFS